MAIKGLFFNAIKSEEGVYDRLYDNEDMCKYLEELVGDGVFPTPTTQLYVSSVANAMRVRVMPGQAWIKGHKMILPEGEEYFLDVSAMPNIINYKRIDRVVMTVDYDNREMTISILEGTPGLNPTTPALRRDEHHYDMGLAILTIYAGDTSIPQRQIKDTRGLSECGWVAGLIQQIDTSSLFTQYYDAFEHSMAEFEAWQEEQQREFAAWYNQLTSNLNVGAYLDQYHKVVQGGDNVTERVFLDMEGYTYSTRDMIMVSLNGLRLSYGLDYTIDRSSIPVVLVLNTSITAGNTLDILAIKTNLQQSGEGLITSIQGNKYVNITDALFNEVIRKVLITNMGETNKVAVANRNLVRIDSLADYVHHEVPEKYDEKAPNYHDGDTDFNVMRLSDGTIYLSGIIPDEDVVIDLGGSLASMVSGYTYTVSINSDDIPASLADRIKFVTGLYVDDKMWGQATDDMKTYYEPADAGYIYTLDRETGVETFTVPTAEEVISDFTPTSKLTALSNHLVIKGESYERIPIELIIKPQLEYGSFKSDWSTNTYSEFTYFTGIMSSNLPILTDTICNIWIEDPAASGLTIAYLVLNSTTDGDSVLYPINSL